MRVSVKDVSVYSSARRLVRKGGFRAKLLTIASMTDALSKGFAHKPRLAGELIELCPFDDEAAEALISMLDEPESLKLTGSVNSWEQALAGSGLDEATTRNWYATRNAQTDRLDLAIYSRELQCYVGEIVLNELDEANCSANLRIFIGKAGQNRGYGTEAIRLLLPYAFGHLPLHRIELEVYAFNPRAQHVYETCGFRVEGVRRDALRFDDAYVDVIIMSVLAHEILS